MGGDGDWFWYAKALRGGIKLYSTLNLSLQPFFVLETAWFQNVFGESWITSKIPAAVHLLALSLGMFFLATKSGWSDRQKAVVLISAFFVGIRLEAYRFDDYHVVADSLIIFSAIAILALQSTQRNTLFVALVIALGIFSGITITTRLNDGAALFLFSALSIGLSPSHMRLLSKWIVYSVSFVATIMIVVSLTGDSIVAWGVNSVVQAGALKGGNSQFLGDPFKVLLTAWLYLWSPEALTVCESLAIALSWTFLVSNFSRRADRTAVIKLIAGILVITVSAFILRDEVTSGNLVYALLAIWTFTAYLLAIYVTARTIIHLTPFRKFVHWHPNELLLLLPFVTILSTSLSSGGNFYDLYMPVAILLLLIPLTEPPPFGRRWIRTTFVAILALMGFSGLWYKTADPASWISYRTSPLFLDRQIVAHPYYGPMVVDKTLLRFITQICTLVNDGTPEVELLSIPFPYANYYCVVPPWHNYVQTWFDSTNKGVVADLLSQLEVAPPKWILYQRQIGTLTYHEITFNNGQVLPQRSLDDFIMNRIAQGEWKVVYRTFYGQDSDWILAKTQTVASPVGNLLTDATNVRHSAGWLIDKTLPTWSIGPDRGGTIVATNQRGSFQESSMSRDISFANAGSVSVSLKLSAEDVDTYVGGIGYTVDLYDATTGLVVGSLGLSNSNQPLRMYSFDANVNAVDRYELRLRFGASSGRVSYSDIAVYDRRQNTHADGSSGRAKVTSIPTTSYEGWTTSPTEPRWSQTSGGQFAVVQNGPIAVESTLSRKIVFSKKASVCVQVTIGAQSLVTGNSFGYIVDLRDVTNGTIAGSIGLPATVSPPRPYSFTASVVPHHTYRIRLRFNAASGTVTFSKLRIEYGTIPSS